MAFVNEYVSAEDIEKYGLAKSYLAMYPGDKKLPDNYAPQWTIDRERNIILRQIRGANPARDGEHWIEFLLELDGKKFFIKVDRVSGSKTLSESPYRVAWGNIVQIYPDDLDDARLRQVTETLKEALTARGYDGARKQIPNTIVTFEF